MGAEGTLTIKTFTEGENVALVIQDQGHGVNPDSIDKLGTPFFTTKEQGTGLGLAVCYGIANRHGASIKIETGDKGTEVFVRFPIDRYDLVIEKTPAELLNQGALALEY